MKIRLKKKKAKVRKSKPIPTSVEDSIVEAITSTPVVPRPRVARVVSYRVPDKRRSNVEWAFEETVKHVGCDRCGASPGCPCVGKKDRELATVHIRRLKAYRKTIGSETYQQRHGGSTIVGKLLGGGL